MKIALRADASIAIGSGHVMRCAALAAALRARGAEIVFVCRTAPGHMAGALEAAGFEVRCLAPAQQGSGWHGDAEATLAALAGSKCDWLIVDHYQLAAPWERQLRSAADRIMVIDDLADRPHAGDILLDQNFYSDSSGRYDAQLPAECLRLLGPAYALLRDEFRQARERQRARDGGVRRILVFFGGSDAGNETAKALAALTRQARPGLAVDVVLGGSNPHRHQIERQYGVLPWMSFHFNVDNMAELMLEADLCIGAGGSTTWERCCVGLPAVLIAVADNQVEIARQCALKGAAIFLGEAADVGAELLNSTLDGLLSQPARLREIGCHASALADGLGTQRVSAALYDMACGVLA